MTRLKLLKEADRVFSLWIRKRDNSTCVICGSRFRPQCGHLIKRGKQSVRFNELNCNCQCASCNYKHNNYPEAYMAWFIRRYGEDAFLKLEEESKIVMQWKSYQLKDIIQRYKS